jgi:Lon protease-like protein
LSPIPLFPLNVVLFPDGPLPLRIFEPRYVDMVGRCMREGCGFGVVFDLGSDVGTLARITDFDQLPDGLLGLTCVGTQRFRILQRSRQPDGLNLGEVSWLDPEPEVALPPRHARLAELLKSVLPQLGDVYGAMTLRLGDAAWVGHRLAEILPIAPAEKQTYLEMDDPVARLDRLAPLA